MVDEDQLSGVLREFARTLVTDFPIQAILDHLVTRIVEVLPVTAAGVTLISADKAPRYVAASDESALRFERLQSEIGQGPCLSAYESGQAVAVPDLATDDRFPLFAPAALEAGLHAVFTFPLSPGEARLGALDLYRDTPGQLDSHAIEAAQTLADVTAAYLLNAQIRQDARTTSELFHRSALYDPLTDLPNRVLLQQRIEHAAARAERSHADAVILFANLDRFKLVNDTHGHKVADQLLVAVAQRLSRLLRPGDTLARVSGDEFVFLCEDLDSTADAEGLAKRIDAAFAEPFVLADAQVTITASVGLAFPGPGEHISNQLMIDAGAAMDQAKRKGGAGHQHIDLREAFETNDRLSLDTDLRAAYTRAELDVAYQPVIRVADGLVTGVEALLRWTDPHRGPVSPLLMVAVAEQSPLINQIGEWILERSCRDHGRWLLEHPGIPLDLAVNVSPRQLMSSDFRSTVAGVLSSTGMDPAALVLEITESTLIDDSERASTVLADLTDLGIRLAMDDFGTGYSSLSYLRRMPIEIVKIDQSFIAGMDDPSVGGAIVVESVTNLAHDLGLTVIAEGVETTAQHDEIARLGCDSAQGYLYGRPMPAGAISTVLGRTPTNSRTSRRPVGLTSR